MHVKLATMRDLRCFVVINTAIFVLLLFVHPSDVAGCTVTMYMDNQKVADCSALGITTIPKDLDSDINHLFFMNNQLTELGPGEFENYQDLTVIFLTENHIKTIASDAFKGLESLEVLVLDMNKLEGIPQDAFQPLSSLILLSMRRMEIHDIPANAFAMLPNIESLDIGAGWLKHVDLQAFEKLSHLEETDLSGNLLKTLSPNMKNYLLASLETFILSSNHWQCDCEIRWLRELLFENSIRMDYPEDGLLLTCLDPHNWGKEWRDLTPDQFTCSTD